MPYVRGGIDYDFLVSITGVADDGSDTELVDNTKDMEANMYQNGYIHIFKIALGTEYVRTIDSNTSNKFTFDTIDPAGVGIKVEEGDEYKVEG